jgi:hypothetical protein
MKRILFSGLAALALSGAAFAQAGNQSKTQDQKSTDDTNFQKGHKDPTEPTKDKKDDQKKKGKAPKSGKDTKGPIDPHEDPNSPTNNPIGGQNPPKGNGPTVPKPATPVTPPTNR